MPAEILTQFLTRCLVIHMRQLLTIITVHARLPLPPPLPPPTSPPPHTQKNFDNNTSTVKVDTDNNQKTAYTNNSPAVCVISFIMAAAKGAMNKSMGTGVFHTVTAFALPPVLTMRHEFRLKTAGLCHG